MVSPDFAFLRFTHPAFISNTYLDGSSMDIDSNDNGLLFSTNPIIFNFSFKKIIFNKPSRNVSTLF